MDMDANFDYTPKKKKKKKNMPNGAPQFHICTISCISA